MNGNGIVSREIFCCLIRIILIKWNKNLNLKKKKGIYYYKKKV